MAYEIRNLPTLEWPDLLHTIPDPPERLRAAGNLAPEGNKLLAIVGSRAMTPYGREAIIRIAEWLEGAPVSIISGLALGVDSAAHRAALRHHIHTIAVPGSGIGFKTIYPRNHAPLAREIIEAGGGLLSEFDDDTPGAPWTFPQRNRIMAGMSHAVLIIEAQEKSGTLITARLALDYNRDVGVIPGSIFSPQSQGVNRLLRDGAQAILEKDDLFDLLKLPKEKKAPDAAHTLKLFESLSPEEQTIVALLKESAKEMDDIIAESHFSPSIVMAIVSSLSLKGIVREEMGEISLATNR